MAGDLGLEVVVVYLFAQPDQYGWPDGFVDEHPVAVVGIRRLAGRAAPLMASGIRPRTAPVFETFETLRLCDDQNKSGGSRNSVHDKRR